ncbi:MAG: hypothetical protein LCH89_21530 [Proteobacteria bacterium]|nr:hypothetical protein [Pseudomonadota bacterium]
MRSPNSVSTGPSLEDIDAWFEAECDFASVSKIEKKLLRHIHKALDVLVRWPARPYLLWQGATRAQKYHRYPDSIKIEAKRFNVHCDTRTNGPAVVAYLLAGGERPKRYGSTNAWSVHHLYSGKFSHPSKNATLHAAKHPLHMTQAAGLVAIHPIADQACDEYPFFSWLLRALAFQKFNYDPDGVFSDKPVDETGFKCRDDASVFFAEQINV